MGQVFNIDIRGNKGYECPWRKIDLGQLPPLRVYQSQLDSKHFFFKAALSVSFLTSLIAEPMLAATHSRALIASSPLPTRHLFTSLRTRFSTAASSLSHQPIPRQPTFTLFSRATNSNNSILYSTPSLFRALHSATTTGPKSTLSTKPPSKRLPAHSPPSPSSPHSQVFPDGSIQVRSPLGFEGTDGLVKVNARLLRDYIQRTPHPPSKDYVTLSYYQFRPIPQKEDLLKIQYFFLTDLRAMDVVGRIYVSAEGINAQISCPKDRVEDFKDYYATQWPIFDKIRFNPAMSEGKAFKKLHVRIKGQVLFLSNSELRLRLFAGQFAWLLNVMAIL